MYAEFELIERIAKKFKSPEGMTLGIGDDCAVLAPGRFDLVTMDTAVEGIHFRTDWASPNDIGWKAMCACLSDIAAMGGGPGAFLLSLALGPAVDEAFVDGLIDGMKDAADSLVPESFEVSAGGGDTVASPGPTVITITLLGEASPAGPVTRSGALPGDRIVILGPTGLSAAGLDLLSGEHGLDPEDFPELVQAHLRPQPRVREGALLGLYGVPSAMIDTSDGLAADLGHLIARSGVGASVETHSLPRTTALGAYCDAAGIDPLPYLLCGGEDFELLLTIPPARMTKLWDLARRNTWDVYDIGEIRSDSEGLRLVAADGTTLDIDSLGYTHF